MIMIHKGSMCNDECFTFFWTSYIKKWKLPSVLDFWEYLYKIVTVIILLKHLKST